MFNAVFIMGGLGLVVGFGLAIASKMFYVYVDPKVAAIDDILPGANCGGCGMPGCFANAEAIVNGIAKPNSCVAAGEDVTVAIADVMGVSIEISEPDIALLDCSYGLIDADIKFIYDGINDCRAAVLLGGGMKVCTIGCIGLGTCVSSCPFNAINMGFNGLPVIDKLKCTGCGTCENVCPKNIIKLSSLTRRILKEYTTKDCTTPCQRACPAGINIREYVHLISLGKYKDAIQIVKERNPFPTVIGRICPRPCEDVCRRKYADESVAINDLKRFASDYERNLGDFILPFKAPVTGKKIAIVGGGVHGLSAAFFSARLGHLPTVFEATDKLGGLLNTAISKYRLPDEVLNWDIEGIARMGVNFKMSTNVGYDITVEDLLEDNFEVVFIASGGWDSRLSLSSYNEIVGPIPGGELLIDFMSDDFLKVRSDRNLEGTRVLFVGGEELLEDILDRCEILEIKEIFLIPSNYSDQNFILSQKKYKSNVSVKIIDNLIFSGLLGTGNHLTHAKFVDNKLRQNVKLLNIQTVVFSSGRFPEIVFTKFSDRDLITGELEKIKINSWIGSFLYKHPDFINNYDLFRRGDAMSDFNSVVEAIASGRRAATGIHEIMYDLEVSLPSDVLNNDSFVQDIHVLEKMPFLNREQIPIIDSSNDYDLYKINETFSKASEIARSEASRCLKCGLICYDRS